MPSLGLNKYKQLLVFTIIPAILLFTFGCSLNTISERVFGKGKAEANLSAEFVHLDQQAINDSIMSMIKGAKNSVYVEQFEFDRKDMIDLLSSKAQQGIEVKVLLDQSTKSAKTTYDLLRSNGVRVQYYPTQKGSFNRVKLLSVDNTHALIGGNDWTAAAGQNHDVALELDGKSAWTAALVFARDWKFATNIDLDLSDLSLPDDNILLATDSRIQPQITTQMQNSKTSIQIELSQLTYPPEIITLLADAAAAGKKVQVILESTQQKINQSTIDQLKAAGAEVRQYPADEQQRLTARFALFDERVTILGSANWTRSSFVQNHELAVTVPSQTVAAKLGQLFSEDWQKSKEVTEAAPNQ